MSSLSRHIEDATKAGLRVTFEPLMKGPVLTHDVRLRLEPVQQPYEGLRECVDYVVSGHDILYGNFDALGFYLGRVLNRVLGRDQLHPSFLDPGPFGKPPGMGDIGPVTYTVEPSNDQENPNVR